MKWLVLLLLKTIYKKYIYSWQPLLNCDSVSIVDSSYYKEFVTQCDHCNTESNKGKCLNFNFTRMRKTTENTNTIKINYRVSSR